MVLGTRQTRLTSLLESVINIGIGFGVALISQILIFPVFSIHVSFVTNLYLGAWFTTISLIRSYLVRRWFNDRLHSTARTIADRVDRIERIL